MGKRGPKPREIKTKPVRIDEDLANILYDRARDDGRPIADFISYHFRDMMLSLLPTPPSVGPPLPQMFKKTWNKKAAKANK